MLFFSPQGCREEGRRRANQNGEHFEGESPAEPAREGGHRLQGQAKVSTWYIKQLVVRHVTNNHHRSVIYICNLTVKWFIWSVNLLAYNQILFGMIFPVMFNFVSCTEYKQYLPHNHKLSFWWIQLTAHRLAAAADWIMHGQNNNLSENEKKSVALLMAVRVRVFFESV